MTEEDNGQSKRHLIDVSRKLRRQRVWDIPELLWRSCIYCQRIFCKDIRSCSTHPSSLTQEEWGVLLMNNPPRSLLSIEESVRWWAREVSDTRNTGL